MTSHSLVEQQLQHQPELDPGAATASGTDHRRADGDRETCRLPWTRA
jgi:hypothetical protein